MKKIAVFLSLVLILSLMTSFVAIADDIIKVQYEILADEPTRTLGVDCYEVFENTSLEIMDSPEQFYSWGVTSHLTMKNTWVGCGLVERSTDAHTGEYALELKTASSEEYVHAVGYGTLKPGETYELSAFVKKLADCERVVIMVQFDGKYKGVPQSYDMLKLEYNDVGVEDGWTKQTMRFTAPDYVQGASFMLRLMGKGNVLYDDVSLLHITTEMPKPEVSPIKPPIEFIGLKNPGFEEDTPGQKPDPSKGWEELRGAVVTDKYAHSGKNSVELNTTGEHDDVRVCVTLGGFKNGATYQLSAWVYNPEDAKADLSYWVDYSSKEFYDWEDKNSQMGEDKVHYMLRKMDGWEQMVLEFTPPDNVNTALIMLCQRVTRGVLYLDDVSLYMVKEPNAVSAETDETFYYTEWPTGFVTATPYIMDDPASSYAEFSFIDLDGAETHKETFSNLTNGVTYTFRTEWMQEKGKRYHIGMKIFGPDGAILQDTKFPVFRFDRPTYLGADGIFRKNGKEYTITLGNQANMQLLDMHPENGGCTVVLLAGDANIPILERLDRVYEQGMLAMIGLYYGRIMAGSEDRIESTKEMVALVKDHPALFGYKIQDEPSQHGTSDEEMITAYEIIHNIDPNHVVYVDDSVPGAYPWLFRYSDLVDIDYYGGADPDAGRVMTTIMGRAMEASKGRKPFTLLEQAFEFMGYMPSVDEMRHMAYQAFFAGAQGYGFHALSSDDGIQPDYMTRPEWQEIVDKWAPWERDFMYGCFITGEYKFLNYAMSNDILWGTFTDGTDIYAIVLNRDKSAAKEAVIPLTDGTGVITVDGFSARTMTGESKRITGSGSMFLSLAPMEAVVWKVTPFAAFDASHLKTSKYRDLLNYPWAYHAIATLEEKRIINEKSPNWYGPGENITRGDYAMFLVRTLGINVAPGENFIDVEADAEYAKELAIGKAAGIINGVGDNKFNPEAQITRQDMMTMTSRAMQLAGTADLGAFSDSGAIADYAASHVSAMVAEGLIKGNADGTINPLGNTTRAEAAVIMNRIINK